MQTIEWRDLVEAARAIPDRPKYDRIEIGRAVRFALAKPQPILPPPVCHSPAPEPLYGIPIVVREDMNPNAWVLLGADGELLGAGTL